MQVNPKASLIALLFVAGLFALAGDPPAQPQTEENPAPEAAQSETPAPGAGMAGMVVVRDPDTGELRAPTAEEASRFLATFDPMNLSEEGIEEYIDENGTVTRVLGGRFMNYTVVHKTAGGRTITTCVKSADEFAAFLKAVKTAEARDEK